MVKRKINRVATVMIIFLTIQLAFIAATIIGERRQRVQNAKQTAIKMSTVAVSNTEDFFKKYIAVCETLKSVDSIIQQERTVSSKLFKRLRDKHPETINFAAVKKDGYFFASGKSMAIGKGPNIKDLDFFKRMAAGERVVIMDPHMGPISKVFVTGIAVRLDSSDGKFNGEVGVSLKFQALIDRWSDLFSKSKTFITVDDGSGKLYYSSPWLKRIGEDRLVDILSGQTGQVQLQDTTFVMKKAESRLSGWRISVFVPAHLDILDVATSRKELVALCLLMIITLIAFSFWFSQERHWISKLQMEKKNLQQSEKDLKASQQIAHLGSWRLNVATNEVVWTKELYNMYGLDPALPPPPYTEHMKFFTPESWEMLSNSLENTKNTGIPYELELETIREDGSNGWMWVRGEAETDSEGKTVGLWGSAQDITERKRAEKELLETHEKTKKQNKTFRAINRLFQKAIECESSFEVAKICLSIAEGITESKFGSVAEVNKNNRFDTLALSNPGWEECRIAELDPKILQDMEIRGIWGATLKNEKGLIVNDPSNHPLSVGTPEGHPPLTCFLGMPFHHKNFTGMIGIANKDGGYTETDRESLQAIALAFAEVINSKRAEESLINSEEKYRSLFNSVNDSIFVHHSSKDGTPQKFVEVNKTACKVYDYTREEILGLTSQDLIVPQEISKIPAMIKKVLSEGQYVFETYHKKKNGELLPVEVSAFLSEIHGELTVMTIVRDMTERIKTEEKLRQAYKMEAIGNLAGGIAHDFNNILSAIIGFTELSLDDVDKDSMIEDNLQEVYTAGKRAKELVAQILAFARQSEEELKPIQVDIIIREVLKFIRSSIPTIIEIKRNIDSDSLIMGNQTQVHQIMMNLCTNAAYAMENDGGTLEVTLKDIAVDKSFSKKMELRPGNYLKLTVSDTGTGIPPDTIDSIFEPYFTTKEAGEGTGMGLAMVHGIIESYGGKITVNSVLAEGTTFTIYVPVTRKRKTQRQYEPEQLPKGAERILFVDDEAPIVRIGSLLLERLGYQVSTRTSSKEALELFRSKPNDFDLIITDMTMPKMTGDKMAIELMKIRPDIPLILCTGYSKKISGESAAEIGIKAFVPKPIVKADLAKAVRKVLDEAKAES